MATNVLPISSDIHVIVEDDDDSVRVDPATGTIEVDNPDGSVDVHLKDRPDPEDRGEDGWFSNLVDDLDAGELSKIANDLMEAIQADDRSREGSLANHARGLTLLGIELKEPGSGTADNSSAVDGQSTVTNPLLLEAVLKGWATAQAELLPAAGPVKIKDDGAETASEDDLAESYERDWNHWFTTTAKEYYPDTRHMLLWGTYFAGKGFKKIYRCPMRRRPVSESVAAKDLIVSDATKDLRSCGRITHQIEMRPSVMKRMKLLGAYRDVAPTQPTPTPNQVTEKIGAIQGTTPPTRPDDQPYTVWECQCELDLDKFIPARVDGDEDETVEGEEPKRTKHPLKGQGIPVPFVVTLDKDSRDILAIRRDWNEDDPECERREMYEEYPYIPGPGFLGTGLLNVLGNASAAMTAAWRLALDSAMFSNFPGGFVSDLGGRQNTSDMRIGPGQWVKLQTSNLPISQVIYPNPYKDVTAGMMAMMDKITQQAASVGGTADMPTAEGIQNVPVGTMLAQIEQATKVEAAVHKGLHTAQTGELQKLKNLFREHPEDFWRGNKVCPKNYWNEQKFLQALDNCNLVPVSDPNVPSHIHRVAKGVALTQLAAMPIFAGRFDLGELLRRVLAIIREDPIGLIQEPPPMPMGGPPQDPAKMVSAQAQMSKAQTAQQEAAIKAQQVGTDAQLQAAKLAAQQKIADTNLEREYVIHAHDADREARAAQHEQGLGIAQHVADQARAAREQSLAEQQHAAETAQADREHGLAAVKTAHDMTMAEKAHELAVKEANKPTPKPAKPKGKK